MMHSIRRHVHHEEDQANFWSSYSDLMAGMLMVFALLMVVFMFHFAKQINQQAEKLTSFHELKRQLVTGLERELKDERVTIDPDTGMLRIGSGILFGENESELREEGREKLHQIFNAYLKVVLAEEFEGFVEQIEIEGHTNSNGTYLYNLELSQRRALTVMTEILAQAGERQGRLEQIVSASGRSYSHLILDDRGMEDPILSRRIEIKCRLRESEMFKNIYSELKLNP